MAFLSAAAALVLLLLSALVQPTTAAADPIDLSSARPDETQGPDAPVTPTLPPNQSALATTSESASDDPTTPPPEVTDPPPPGASGSETSSPTDGPTDTPSTSPSPTESPSPTDGGSSVPPSVTPNGSSSSVVSTPPTTPVPPVTPTGGTTSTPTGGTTTTPVPPIKTAPATKNAKWATALFDAPKGGSSNAATLAPSVNTVPVVTARAVCQGIVFANPDSAYPAAVAYGRFGSSPKTPVTLPPTGTKFVAVSTESVDWAALSQDPASGASNQVVGAAGFGESVKIPQCKRTAGEIHAVAMAPCLARGQDAVIMVNKDDQAADNSELSWRISRKGDPLVLAQGVLGRNGVSSVDVSSFGVGTYTVTVLQNGKVEDHVDFEALDCVATTTTTCNTVTVTNPIRNPVPVTVTWRSDTSRKDRAKQAKVVTLQPGSYVDVPAVAGSLQWSAISTGMRSGLTSLIGDAGSDLTVATETCTPAPSATDGPTTRPSGPGTTGGTTASPVASSESGRADPSSAGPTSGGAPVTIDTGSDIASSAALLGGIAVGGAALVWLLAALLRRRP